LDNLAVRPVQWTWGACAISLYETDMKNPKTSVRNATDKAPHVRRSDGILVIPKSEIIEIENAVHYLIGDKLDVARRIIFGGNERIAISFDKELIPYLNTGKGYHHIEDGRLYFRPIPRLLIRVRDAYRQYLASQLKSSVIDDGARCFLSIDGVRLARERVMILPWRYEQWPVWWKGDISALLIDLNHRNE